MFGLTGESTAPFVPHWSRGDAGTQERGGRTARGRCLKRSGAVWSVVGRNKGGASAVADVIATLSPCDSLAAGPVPTAGAGPLIYPRSGHAGVAVADSHARKATATVMTRDAKDGEGEVLGSLTSVHARRTYRPRSPLA